MRPRPAHARALAHAIFSSNPSPVLVETVFIFKALKENPRVTKGPSGFLA